MTKVNFPILTFNEAGIQIIDGDRGFAYPKSSDFMESGYCLFLTAQNVTSDGFKFNEGQFVSEKKHNELRKGTLQRQDIVLTSRGTVGNVALYDDRIPYDVLRINSGMLILRNSGKSFETDYLYALLRSPLFKKQIRRLSFGSAQPQITVQVTNGFEFPCPSKPEQKKIAEILSSWDRAIETLGKLIDVKAKFKTGLMQKLLTGKMRFKVFNGNLFERKSLGQVAKINMGQSPSSEFYNKDRTGLPLIQGNADCKNRKTFPTTYTTQITKRACIGDIIMSVRAPVGTIAKCRHEVCIGRGVCAIRGEKIDNEYLYQFLLSFETRWNRFAQGSTFTAVNSNDIKKLPFAFPKDARGQKKIAQILLSADRELEFLSSMLDMLTSQKKGLMQKLLTGKIRVKA